MSGHYGYGMIPSDSVLKMKNPKKILLACLPVLLLFSMVSMLFAPSASAFVATSPQQIQNAAFEFKNRGLIVVTIGGEKISFINDDPFSHREIKFEADNYECSAEITLPVEKFGLDKLGDYPGSLDPKYIKIQYDENRGSGCLDAEVTKAPRGVDVGMRTWFNWVDAGTIELIDGSRAFKKTGNNDYFLYTGENRQSCQDRVFLSTRTTRAGDNTPTQVETNRGRYFELDKNKGLGVKGTAAENLGLGDCKIYAYNLMDSLGSEERFNKFYASGLFQIGEEQNKVKAANTGQITDRQSGGGSDSDDACSLKGFTLNWVFCPMIYAVDEGFNEINEFVEGQLNYDTEKYLTNDIKRTWSIVRVIATSLLVIVMLVMIISQAINAGIFDAYTVRKVLPRLVVAAILMQLSWPLTEWVITLANNAGRGIFDLLAVPFGGREQLELEQILGKMGNFAPSATVITAMLAAVAISFFNPFGVLLFAFSVLLAVLVAAATLLFRNILILACVILAPLALLAWILPGTKKYWDMWKDNFTKALLLFPIIMAMVVVGRIFAYIVAGTEGGIFDWLAVLVGFFGPYFLLPKAFKWGGSLMATAGNTINGFGETFGKKPREFLKGRQEGYQAEKLLKSQERVSKGLDKFTRNPRSWVTNPVDKLRSGKWDPTLGLPGSRRRERALTSYSARGAGSEEEDVKAANTRFQMQIDRLHPDDQDTYMQEIAAGRSAIIGSNGRLQRDGAGNLIRGDREPTVTERRAALDQLVRLGGETNIGHIERIMSEIVQGGDTDMIEMSNKFKTANVGTLFKKLPHLYKNPDFETGGASRTIGGLNAKDLTELSGVGMRTLIETTNARAQAGDTQAQADLRRLTTLFQQAANDENLRGHIPSDVARHMRNFVTSGAAAAQGVDAGVIRDITRRVTDQGVVIAPESTRGPTTMAPGEIKISHRESAQVNLPSASLLSPGSTEREAYKARLKVDPATVQSLVNGLAYGAIPSPERSAHLDVIAELRTEAQNAGTAEAKDQYNKIVDQLISGVSQRATDTTQRITEDSRNAGLTDAEVAERQARVQSAASQQITDYHALRLS